MATSTSPLPSPLLQRREADHIMTLVLNNPQKLNPLSTPMLLALQEALTEIGQDPTIHVVILAAEGRGFCAGHDVSELATDNSESHHALFELCSSIMIGIHQLPQPIIACVQGACAAAGCQLALACDLIVSSSLAHFSTPGINIGLFCHTPGVELGRSLPPRLALELLLTGERMDAATAHRHGVVNRLVDDSAEWSNKTSPPLPVFDSLRYKETLALAKVIAAKPPIPIFSGKRTYYEQMERGGDFKGAYSVAVPKIGDDVGADDAQHGIAAFLKKIPPRWATAK